MHYVYFLRSNRNPSKTYTGKSNNPLRRLNEHNSDANDGWTAQFKPWHIEACVTCENEETARIVENYFKNASGKEKFKHFKDANPIHPHPKQGFFDTLAEGKVFGRSEENGGNGRFSVIKINGQTLFKK